MKQDAGDRQQETGNATGNREPGMILRKGEDIATRLQWLGAVVLRVASNADERPAEQRHVITQLLRAGTSCGANYEEARSAESRADFIHKVSVAAKEARETAFWFRMLDSCSPNSPEISRAIDEAAQLAAILGASARTARRNGG